MFRVYSRGKRLRGRLDRVAVVIRGDRFVVAAGKYGTGEVYAEATPDEYVDVALLCEYASRIAKNVYLDPYALILERRFFLAVERFLSDSDANPDAD